MVERFNSSTIMWSLDGCDLRPDDKGEWVRHSDYAALSAELETVKGERDKWKHAFAAQSRKLQAVLYIPGVKEELATLTHPVPTHNDGSGEAVTAKIEAIDMLLKADDVWTDYGSGFRVHFSFPPNSSYMAVVERINTARALEAALRGDAS